MRKYLSEYLSDFKPALNMALMNKDADRELIEYVKDAWVSLEILKNIKIVDFHYIEREADIDINSYIFKRDKKKKKKDRHALKFVNDDRYGSLTVYIDITIEELNTQTKKPVIKTKRIKKQILIPLKDDDGYYHLKGKKYYMIFQMVDKSTYISSSAVTLKSLMPIAVKRQILESETFELTNTNKHDINGTIYKLPVYNVFVFKKEIPVILFYLANGLDYAMSYLGVSDVISFEAEIKNPDHDKYIYFQMAMKCFIKVRKSMFLNHQYIQSIVGGLLNVGTNRMTIDKLRDKRIWLKKLSNNNTVKKGEDILTFFNRLMDETTKKILLLNDFNKKDIYAILRWMMQNFSELREKDNLSLYNKRLRCNEYIASLLTQEFSKRLNRIITLGAKATMDDYTDMFGFSGDILLQKMHTSGILKFDDNINDMTFFSKFKYTTKGPNSLGRKNSNNISAKYRGIHPSMIGHIDLLVCGSNDPGTSGILSPFGAIEGLYFDNDTEPDDFFYNFTQELIKIAEDENTEYLSIKADNKTDYYAILDKLSAMNDDMIRIYGTTTDEYTIILDSSDNEQEENNSSVEV